HRLGLRLQPVGGAAGLFGPLTRPSTRARAGESSPSPSGPCGTFQDAAYGYWRGEGLGIVLSSGVRSAAARPAPSPSRTPAPPCGRTCTATCWLRLALKPPSLATSILSRTASQAGDTAGVFSIAAGYPLYVGVVKANIGHGGDGRDHGIPN
ncbi:beta-ketoacyl synthase domain-containing protein, partial [Colletotrichum paranaense]